jgi:hypothetical protein
MRESPTSDHFPLRTGIAISIFVVCCLLSSARLVWDTPAPGRLHADDIARRSDQRFAALKAELPQRGVVGYIGESGSLAVGDYYLTQYALAPLVVDHSTNHPLVVGNFPHPLPVDTTAPRLHLVKDFGDGVLLLANEDAR